MYPCVQVLNCRREQKRLFVPASLLSQPVLTDVANIKLRRRRRGPAEHTPQDECGGDDDRSGCEPQPPHSRLARGEAVTMIPNAI